MLSIVTPAYNEAVNLPLLYERLCRAMATLDMPWEWVVVDDHSTDDSFAVISELAAKDSRVRGLRFSRNFGSHAAFLCGFQHASGDIAVGMAGDGQDPPETIPTLVDEWRNGAQVVWAARASRNSDTVSKRFFAYLYYWLMRRVVGIREMPASGADFFLIDRMVIDALDQCRENGMSILALITWVGFKQTTVTYDRQPRIHGASRWSLAKKLTLVVDSVVSFSYLPIRLMALVGIIVALVGLAYTPVIVINALIGEPAQGWTELMVVILVIGGLQMLMLAVLGEYLWRTLESARGRPRFLIERTTQGTTRAESDGPTQRAKKAV